MKDIQDREDISLLVHTFYESIRKNELLGPIFNMHIQEEQWPAHLEKLTDFWVTALLGVACFKGNPTFAHITVDKNLKHTISPEHFEQWVSLWHTTINSLYKGDIADRAKRAAINMAHGQFNAVSNYRNQV